MNGNYLVLASRIEAELARIAPLVQRAQAAWQRAVETGDDLYVDAAAVNLHSFYSGIERILEAIADSIDEAKPTGDNWHRALLQQMTLSLPGLRPAVFSLTTVELLDKYRGFRHVVLTIFASFLAQAGREQ